MINRRLLVQSKWCKKEKKEKSEPSRVSNPGLQFRKDIYALGLLIAWIQNM
jgi:hypothetical protein